MTAIYLCYMYIKIDYNVTPKNDFDYLERVNQII